MANVLTDCGVVLQVGLGDIDTGMTFDIQSMMQNVNDSTKEIFAHFLPEDTVIDNNGDTSIDCPISRKSAVSSYGTICRKQIRNRYGKKSTRFLLRHYKNMLSLKRRCSKIKRKYPLLSDILRKSPNKDRMSPSSVKQPMSNSVLSNSSEGSHSSKQIDTLTKETQLSLSSSNANAILQNKQASNSLKCLSKNYTCLKRLLQQPLIKGHDVTFSMFSTSANTNPGKAQQIPSDEISPGNMNTDSSRNQCPLVPNGRTSIDILTRLLRSPPLVNPLSNNKALHEGIIRTLNREEASQNKDFIHPTSLHGNNNRCSNSIGVKVKQERIPYLVHLWEVDEKGETKPLDSKMRDEGYGISPTMDFKNGLITGNFEIESTLSHSKIEHCNDGCNRSLLDIASNVNDRDTPKGYPSAEIGFNKFGKSSWLNSYTEECCDLSPNNLSQESKFETNRITSLLSVQQCVHTKLDPVDKPCVTRICQLGCAGAQCDVKTLNTSKLLTHHDVQELKVSKRR